MEKCRVHFNLRVKQKAQDITKGNLHLLKGVAQKE